MIRLLVGMVKLGSKTVVWRGGMRLVEGKNSRKINRKIIIDRFQASSSKFSDLNRSRREVRSTWSGPAALIRETVGRRAGAGQLLLVAICLPKQYV